MKPVYTCELKVSTEPGNFYVLTERVADVVRKSGIDHGLCVLFLPSTTCFLLLQENCEMLKEDLKRVFRSIAPPDGIYAHPDNAHSHILSSFLGGERIIPVKNRELELGTWQEIMLYEADVKPRERKIKVIVSSFFPVPVIPVKKKLV